MRNINFRTNTYLAKNGKFYSEKAWLKPLFKYLSEDASFDLSLFVDEKDVAEASLKIVDKGLCFNAKHTDSNKYVALTSVIDKCKFQIIKSKANEENRETIRHTEDYDMSFEAINGYIDLNSDLVSDFEMLEAEQKLISEKKSQKYNRAVNKYVDYLNSTYDCNRALKWLKDLWSTFENVDLEEISAADYIRLMQSIEQIHKEIYLLMEQRNAYENNVKQNQYIEEIIDSEYKILDLKRNK